MKYIRVATYMLAVFILVSLVSYAGQMAADGIVRIGFPLEFISFSNAKGAMPLAFSPILLLADLLFAFLSAWLLHIGLKRLRRRA